MTTEHKRYMYSAAHQTEDDTVIHDTEHLDERCNTDQIADADRRYNDDLDYLLSEINVSHACVWCIQNKQPEGAEDGAPT